MIDRYITIGLSPIKDKYGNWVKYEDHEKVRDELLEALIEIRNAEWMVTHDWGGDRRSVLDKVESLIEKHTGKPIEEVLQEAE